MNFTQGGVGFNFSGTAQQFACCPDGMSCLVMGPVWGMCMPAWGKPTASATATPEVLAALAARSPEVVTALSAVAAEISLKAGSKKQEAKEKAKAKEEAKEKAKEKDAKEEPKEADEPPAPCTTKPFGQCAGMNFTAPAATYNFSKSAPAPSLACCPAGTSCVTFGPVWGMCMPAFGKPPARV